MLAASPSDAGASAGSSTARSAFDEEMRELLSSRLTIFVGIVFGMRALAIVALSLAQWAKDVEPRWYQTSQGQIGLTGTLLLVLALIVLRNVRLSLRALRALDFGLLLVLAPIGPLSIAITDQARTITGSLSASSFETHQLKVLLLFAHAVLLRAALIPSRPLRTGLIGATAGLLHALATVFVHQRLGSPLPVAVTLTGSLVLATFSVLVSIATSAVIAGLQRKVRNATRLGQYTLEDKLGEGGMGTVYRARHALLRRPTAIKVLSTERIGAAAIERFEREVQVTARLSHPNIVSVYDFGHSNDGTFYYAMEFLDGVDLQKLVDRGGPQHPGRVVRLLRQAAEALSEAHAVDLIHRDVKPANMILVERAAESDVLKLVDFGLVKELEQARGVTESSVTLQGTPLYMAPESIVGPTQVGPRS
ncbi:MAG TPA: serine/threonine-protein kinase, partial [Polyangiaceae bacterium]